MPLIHPLVLDQSFQMSVKRYGSPSYICSGICLLQSLLIFCQEGLVLSQNLIADGLQFHQLFGTSSKEPHEIFEGQASIVICDGYAGNILIKSGEGVSNMLAHSLIENLTNSDLTQVQLEKIMQTWQSQFDPNRLNGAFLLGLQGLVVKSHSYANAAALQYAIEATQGYVEMQVAKRLQEDS